MEMAATQPLTLCPPSQTHWAISVDANFQALLENRVTERMAQAKGNKGKVKAKPKIAPHSALKTDPPKKTSQGPTQKADPGTRTHKKSNNNQGGNPERPVVHLMGDANLLGDTGIDEDLAG